MQKLRNSLRHSGAKDDLVEQIVNQVREELYQGISTKEIYNRAFALLKKKRHLSLQSTSLKKQFMNWAQRDFLSRNLFPLSLSFPGTGQK